MLKIARNLKGIVTVAVLCAVVLTAAAPMANAQKARQYKDPSEFDPYNEVIKDLNAKNFEKMVKDLDAWKAKYPTSEYADLWQVYYIQAYSGSKQCGKALELARDLMDKDLDKLFPDLGDVQHEITILYTAMGCLSQLTSPTPKDLETIKKAAEKLASFDRIPKGTTDAAWAEFKKQLKPAIDGTLLTVAVLPGNQAMAKQPPDCQTAEKVFSTALTSYPDNTFISYSLGRAWYCIALANNQEKVKEFAPKALYEFARSIALDPTLKGSQEPKALISSVTRIYTSFHGSDEGLEDLKAEAKKAPLPPAGFSIKTGGEIALEKEKAFEEKYPQLAIWMRIKGQLSGPGGPAYFDGTMKNADIPKLKGTLVEGACRAKSLLVSFPEPEQKGTAPTVVTLKLDAPLKGKPDTGVEIQFKGVPTEFTSDPFMLTLETEVANIEGLKTTACVAAVPKAAPKKGVTPKKK